MQVNDIQADATHLALTEASAQSGNSVAIEDGIPVINTTYHSPETDAAVGTSSLFTIDASSLTDLGGSVEEYYLSFPADTPEVVTELFSLTSDKLTIVSNSNAAIDYETFVKFAADADGNYSSDYVNFDDGLVTITLNLNTTGGIATTPVKFNFTIADTAVNTGNLTLEDGIFNPTYDQATNTIDTKVSYTESDAGTSQFTLFTLNESSLSDLGGSDTESYVVTLNGLAGPLASLVEVDPNNPLSVRVKSGVIFDYESLANDPNVDFDNGVVTVTAQVGTVGGKELTEFNFKFNVGDTKVDISNLEATGQASTGNLNILGDTILTNLMFYEGDGVAGSIFGSHQTFSGPATLLEINPAILSDLGGGDTEIYQLTFPENTPDAITSLFKLGPDKLSIVTADNPNFDYETLANLDNPNVEVQNSYVSLKLQLATVGGKLLTDLSFSFYISDSNPIVTDLAADGAITNSGTNVAFDANSSTIKTDLSFIESDQPQSFTNLFTINPAYLSDPGGDTETYELSFAGGLPPALLDLFQLSADKLSIETKTDADGNSIAHFDYEALSTLPQFSAGVLTVPLVLNTVGGIANTLFSFSVTIIDVAPLDFGMFLRVQID